MAPLWVEVKKGGIRGGQSGIAGTLLRRSDDRRIQRNWRTEWDSNPRTPVKMLLDFQSSAFDRSAICPFTPALRRGANNTSLRLRRRLLWNVKRRRRVQAGVLLAAPRGLRCIEGRDLQGV
jgi:hypothetical protein